MKRLKYYNDIIIENNLLEYDKLNIILYDQYNNKIFEFENINNSIIGFNYIVDGDDEYSIGNNIISDFEIITEYNFNEFYNLMIEIFNNYECFLTISDNWVNFIYTNFNKHYIEELKRLKNMNNKSTFCKYIIDEYQKEKSEEKIIEEFNI